MSGTNEKQEQARTILAVAPNGSRRGKADHPAIPLTRDEILREAAEWRDAGASVLHLHVRDRDGRHSLDADAYAELFDKLRPIVGPEMVLQMTTESGGIFGREAQIEALKAVRPEAVSLALREIAPEECDAAEFAALLGWMRKERIAPQIILYDRADLNRLLAWARQGDVDASALSVLFVLGRYSADQRSNPVDLLGFLGVETLPFRDWMVCAFGPNEGRCAALAALLGGHVRAGFENNFYLASGEVAQSNAELIGATAAMLKALHVNLAAPADARALWRIG
ncbi:MULTISPECIES: 3-keto-5-aminohexanoate cleavage protein [Rhodomicrobium]|uniref:3-keto-5-aminohexanoate cleavage protein n=1 Tax=Rhodomicrobium TaxID=1068 RepID=UPI000B4BBB6A|nr:MULTISPECIES: 3-keto-5-aminohexanoate cleavage protein [Rhodomicrobium]